LIWSFVAHEPSTGPVDPNFGSLDKFAEVWSTISNCGKLDYLVTASEDQTCKIWAVKNSIGNPKVV
jgi:hypothetical protein